MSSPVIPANTFMHIPACSDWFILFFSAFSTAVVHSRPDLCSVRPPLPVNHLPSSTCPAVFKDILFSFRSTKNTFLISVWRLCSLSCCFNTNLTDIKLAWCKLDYYRLDTGYGWWRKCLIHADPNHCSSMWNRAPCQCLAVPELRNQRALSS